MTNPQQALIGILMTGETHQDLMPQLSEHLFNEVLTSRCYQVIKKAIEKGLTPNLVNFFMTANELGKFTPKETSEIVTWSNNLTYNEPVNEYIAILKDEHIKRSISLIVTEQSLGLLNNDGYTTATSIIKSLTNLLDTGTNSDNIIDLSELTNDEREAYYRRAALTLSVKTT